MQCDCCGKGLIEIKCPFKHRDKHPHSIDDHSFYLKKDEDGSMHLSKDHDYFYQVQGQLAVCDLDFCDFICWTPLGMHCERITFDQTFFDVIKPALDKFFTSVLLPMLLTGKTTIASSTEAGSCGITSQEKEPGCKTYCWCNGEDEGKMIACDNETCSREWFHFDCVGPTRKPMGKWFCCDDCRKLDLISNAS